MRKIVVIFSLLLCAFSARAHVFGIVLDEQGYPLVGASIYWANTTVGTATDQDGRFELEPVHSTRRLVASFTGCHNDTIEAREHKAITFVLVQDIQLGEVSVTDRKTAVLRSRVSPLNVQTLNSAELCKAACCNLSGSFETSAAVDVSYADAATGAKQIRLLGLSGTYVQTLTENTPNIRGLAQSYGMDYIPGPWMDAIQVSKGTSSVKNGYESVTGQINVEYLKPQTADPLAINAMIDKELMAELNLTGTWQVDSLASTALLLHANGGGLEVDHNGDGFLDMPRGYNVNALNRWWVKRGNYGAQILVRGLYDRRFGGHTSTAKKTFVNPYSIDLATWRLDGFMKNGIVLDDDLNRSVGIITAASYHNQQNQYGNLDWSANQANAYLNAMFETDIDDDARDSLQLHSHRISTGLSVNYDRYRELLSLLPGNFNRDEVTPGAYFEYTYTYKDRLTLLAGVRADWSSRYGFFFTPRLNVRYAPFAWWTLRASAGLGHRSPNLLADNAAYLASNRTWLMPDKPVLERAWNSGVTMTFYIPIGERELQLSGEYYYTRFHDGVIIDLDRSMAAVTFYNISDYRGLQSFAHNWQVEASMEVLRGWTWTLAFRYTDARQSTYNSAADEFQLRDKALQNRFKGIISTSYQTPLKKWQFDVTAQFNGPGRMPDGFVIPEGNHQYYTSGGVVYHTWYPQLMAQITKYFKTASIYLGAENMTNFMQHDPILGARNADGYVDPAQAGYDAAMVWAPIHGWKIYLGFRWNLEKPDTDNP